MWDKQRMASAANMCYAFGLPGNRIESTQNASEYWDMLSHLLPHLLPNLLLRFLLSLKHSCRQALQVLGDVLGADLVIHKGPADTPHASPHSMCC